MRCLTSVAAALAVTFLVSCSSDEPELWSGPVVWGPMSTGQCVPETSNRRYSATLHGAYGEDACLAGPPINVMGVVFDNPSACLEDEAYWDVRDSTCASTLPVLPGPGPSGVPDQPAEGYADIHNHLLAHVAFGETVFWGASYGEPQDALRPIPEAIRGPHQRVEAFTSAKSILDIYDSHDEFGYPSYSGWPTTVTRTHQQSHVDWLHRAYRGGLRLLVVHAVNNQDMFGRGETRTPTWLKPVAELLGSGAVPAPHRSSNDMEALEHQVRAAHELVAWVAEHRGGWLEIAETPDEASELIKAGKMALVLGSEVDHILNCDLGRRCGQAHIEEGLNKLEALGFAVLFPTHHKETQFGDAANFSVLSTGPVRKCPAYTQDCAARGMSKLGKFFVTEMMSRGMMVDLGHGGEKPFEDVMQLVQPYEYPVLMSHAYVHPTQGNGSSEYTLTYEQLRQIDRVGGMVSLHAAEGEYAGPANSARAIPFASASGGGGYIHSYLYYLDALDGIYRDPQDLSRGGKIAFAADWNGFAGWPSGRFGPHTAAPRLMEASGKPLPHPPRLEYPLRLPPNLVPAASGGANSLEKMVFGEKTFDFNKSGLAHSGLSPDLLADMRLHGLSEADLDPFYRAARGFGEMWARARELKVSRDRGWLRWIPRSLTDLIELDVLDRTRLVEVSPGITICRNRHSGRVGSLNKGRCEISRQAENRESSDTLSIELRNANSGMCIESADLAGKVRAPVVQRPCSGESKQQWVFRRAGGENSSGLISAMGTDNCLDVANDVAELAPCDTAAKVRVERIGNTFRILDQNNQCLHVEQRSLKSDSPVVSAACPPPGRADFHWEVDALRDEVGIEYLFSVRSLDGTVAWDEPESPTLPFPVLDEKGAKLCRVSGTLGHVANEECRLPLGNRQLLELNPDLDPKSYEVLNASAPLVH